ncbi:hypothetical protein [Polaromonas sp. CG9_12]|nr:hypothetical protein [Polaromonas sp. CG9_12]
MAALKKVKSSSELNARCLAPASAACAAAGRAGSSDQGALCDEKAVRAIHY